MRKKKSSIDDGFDIKIEEVVTEQGENVVDELAIDFDISDNDEPVPRRLEDYDKKYTVKETGKSKTVKEKAERKIEHRPTSEQNISARYKNGILQSYDVELYAGRITVFDEHKKMYVKKKIRKKKSFASLEEARFWRNEVKKELDDKKKAEQEPSTKSWKIDEVIEECRVHKINIERQSESYMMDFDRYASRAKVYFCDENDLSKVKSIKKTDIEYYLLHLKQHYDYSYQTLVKHKSFLSGLWEFMLDDEKYDVRRNVVTKAIIPADKSAYKARMLTQEQIEELIIEACKQEEPFFLFLVVFSITQALRRGELCGLKWGDVDWKKKIVTIQHNKVQISGRDNVKDPKMGVIRYIELHQAGYDTLRLYKQWQEKYLKRPVKDDEFVLKTTVNLKYNYDPHTGKISRKWKEIYAKINKQREKEGKEIIPYGRIHDGRHVYATKLLQGDKMYERVEENGVITKKETVIHPVTAYVQVYQSMGHSLPPALRNTTTSKYNEHTDARFEITAFWNKYITINVKEEWENQVKQRAEEWGKLTQVQKDKKLLAKEARLEKAYREKLKGNPPEDVVVEYTKDGPLPSFEEKDL